MAELRASLAAVGLPLIVRVGAMPQLLGDLHREFAFTHLLSHEETGPGWSYTRDKAVATWCRQLNVAWMQCPQTGVVRPLRSRFGWAAAWPRGTNAPQAVVSGGFKAAPGAPHSAACPLPTLRELGLTLPALPLPPAGERAAQATLNSFLAGCGRDYRRALSSPLTAAEGCSRLRD